MTLDGIMKEAMISVRARGRFTFESCGRAAVALTVAVQVGACSHVPSSATHARAKPSVPRVVQASADHPGWAVFTPVGDLPIGAIAPGFSTHMWATQSGPNGVVLRVAFDGTFDPIRSPAKDARAMGVSLGPRGDMWVAEGAAGKIGEITMPDGPIVEFPLPRPDEEPIAITMGADRDLWYVDSGVGIVGKMTSSGIATEYHLLKLDIPAAIAPSPNGDIWICGEGGGPDSGGYRPYAARVSSAGKVAEYALGYEDAQPVDVAVGGDGDAWVTLVESGLHPSVIVRVTPAGTMTRFAAGGRPRAIAASGPDRLDYTLDGVPAFGEITTSGVVSTLPLPGGPTARATALAVAPSGDEWFAGSLGGKTALFVRLPSKIDVSPASITLAEAGASQKLRATEKKYAGKWTIQSSDDGIADATGGKLTGEFTVVAISQGTCTLTIADKKGNSIAIPVTVR